ncbi:MAG: hypothetical protein CM15mV60_520 [uncultured marine virus]|nr:MAG: hypothetical protein CM15mV60_520 [uncultured marine virus]
MANTKQVKSVNPLIKGLPGGSSLQVTVFLIPFSPNNAGTVSNTLLAADLNETSLEQSLTTCCNDRRKRSENCCKGLKNDYSF